MSCNPGFNCGEAVNFASADWFLFGAEASQRYALLRAFPIIPYEELLCKEAMLLYKSIKRRGSHHTAADSVSHLSIKLSFVRLVRFYEETLDRSTNTTTGSSSTSTPMPRGTIICSICKRDRYLSYMICTSCCSSSICLNHGTSA